MDKVWLFVACGQRYVATDIRYGFLLHCLGKGVATLLLIEEGAYVAGSCCLQTLPLGRTLPLIWFPRFLSYLNTYIAVGQTHGI